MSWHVGSSWYGPRFQRFVRDLSPLIAPGVVSITHEATPNASSKFEVTVNGELVHSKLGGQGFPDSPAKMDRVVQAIKQASEQMPA